MKIITLKSDNKFIQSGPLCALTHLLYNCMIFSCVINQPTLYTLHSASIPSISSMQFFSSYQHFAIF